MTDRLPELPEDWDRRPAVAAHPGDVEYGAASPVARWTAPGKTVPEAEERAGAREVGVEVVEFLDHRAVGLAALDAARDAGNRWIFPELADEGLEPWGGVRYVCFDGAAKPTHGVDITGEPLQRGIASLTAHAEYTKGLGGDGPDPGPFLTWAAQREGPALGRRGNDSVRCSRSHVRTAATLEAVMIYGTLSSVAAR